MFLICQRCFEKIFEPLRFDEYISSMTESKCIICNEIVELIEPVCKVDESGKIIRKNDSTE